MRIRKSELKELIQEVITEATGVWGDEIAPGQLPKNMQKKAQQATALMMGGGSKSPKRIEVAGKDVYFVYGGASGTGSKGNQISLQKMRKLEGLGALFLYVKGGEYAVAFRQSGLR